MKRFATIIALVAAFILTASSVCAQTVKKDFDLNGFTSVELSNDFKATIQKSNDFSVSVELSEELAPYLDVRVSKGALIIALRNVPTKLTLLKKNVIEASISMPDLRGVSLNDGVKLSVAGRFDLGNNDFTLSTAGASEVKQMEIHAKNATLSLAGASRIHLSGYFATVDITSAGTSRLDLGANADELFVKSSGTAVSEIEGSFDTIDLDLGGTSNVTLNGKTDDLKVKASTAGSVDALRMPAATADVSLSGAGVCKVYVKEALEVQCTGASTCSYKADGDIRMNPKEIARTATLKKL